MKREENENEGSTTTKEGKKATRNERQMHHLVVQLLSTWPSHFGRIFNFRVHPWYLSHRIKRHAQIVEMLPLLHAFSVIHLLFLLASLFVLLL